MKVALERLERSRVRLEVDVAEEEVHQAWQDAVHRVVRRASIPGFRKGKAPRALVERHLGHEVFRREALDQLLPEAYARAVSQTLVEPVDWPDMEVLEFEEGRALRFAATVDVRPEVELGQCRGMGLELEPVAVTSEEVDRELEGLREAHAQLEDRGDEPLRSGWFALIGYRAATGDRSLDDEPERERLLELGAPGLAPGLSEALDGARAGEVREFTLTLPEDPSHGPAAGREVRVRATVKAVKEKVLPGRDDELARTVAGLDTLEELTRKVKNRLTEVARQEAVLKARDTILIRVVEEARVELPETMVLRRQAAIKEDLEQDLARHGLTLEAYLKAAGVETGQFEADLRARAEREVKLDLVLDAVVRAEGLTVTEAELEEEYQKLGRRSGQPVEAVRQSLLSREGAREALERQLARHKAIDLLLKANTTGLEAAEGQEEAAR